MNFPQGSVHPQFLCCPRYSPDSRWIVFAISGQTIWVVPSQGGEATLVAHGHKPVWDADSTAIIYSNADPGRNYSLWQQPFSTAEGKATEEPSPLTVSRGWDMPGGLSRDGKHIAFSAIHEQFNLATHPFDDEAGRVTGPAKPITTGNQRVSFFSVSPDSRSLAYDSTRAAESHIWRADIDGTTVQLTSGPDFNEGSPQWSPDGRTISFFRAPTKQSKLNTGAWLMAADGANPRLLIGGAGSNFVGAGRWLPDGSGLVYRQSKDQQLYVFQLSSRADRRLTNEQSLMPIFNVSPDGKWVVYQSTLSGIIDLRARADRRRRTTDCGRDQASRVSSVFLAFRPLAVLPARSQESVASSRSCSELESGRAGEGGRIRRVGLLD